MPPVSPPLLVPMWFFIHPKYSTNKLAELRCLALKVLYDSTITPTQNWDLTALVNIFIEQSFKAFLNRNIDWHKYCLHSTAKKVYFFLFSFICSSWFNAFFFMKIQLKLVQNEVLVFCCYQLYSVVQARQQAHEKKIMGEIMINCVNKNHLWNSNTYLIGIR